MLDVQTSPVKHHVSVAAIKRLGFLLGILFALSLFLLSYFTQSTSSLNEVLTPPQRIGGDQIKPYIESQFQQARWYSLIESIETHDNETTLKTFIFPDQEGRELADEIVSDLRHRGIIGDISIYGRNITYSLLIHR